MGLRVVENDTFLPQAQTSASLQIATLKDKFSFPTPLTSLCGRCKSRGGGEGELGGAQLFVNGVR
jgi:hypothetical protein